MGVVEDVSGLVKSVQNPEAGELVLHHSNPREALDAITQEQKKKDEELMKKKHSGKPEAFWRAPRPKL